MQKLIARINFVRPLSNQRIQSKKDQKMSNNFWPLVWSALKGGPNVKLEGKIGRDNLSPSPPITSTHPSLEFNLFKLLFTLLYTNWSDYKPRLLMGTPCLSVVVEFNFAKAKIKWKLQINTYLGATFCFCLVMSKCMMMVKM